MGAVAQRHEGQQGPVVLGGGVAAVLDAEPALDLRAAGMVEVDDGDEGDEGLAGGRLAVGDRHGAGFLGWDGGRGGEGKGREGELATRVLP